MKRMLSAWRNVLIHPGEGVFEKELADPNATLRTGIQWLGIGITLSAILSGISTFLYESFSTAYVGTRSFLVISLLGKLGITFDPLSIRDWISSPMAGGLFAFFVFLIGAPLMLLIAFVSAFGLAELLGGKGSFSKQTYALALFVPSLMIIANALGMFRLIGVCMVTPVLWVFAIILSIFAIKVVYGLSRIKSSIIVVTLYLVITLVVIILNPPRL
ncbi:MAG: hypothetical protein HZB51_04765 [Chloroflexi bacterium]|nr:hypothetical protein [Chloroflexota bacterium]